MVRKDILEEPQCLFVLYVVKKTPVGLPFEMIVDCEIRWDCRECISEGLKD